VAWLGQLEKKKKETYFLLDSYEQHVFLHSEYLIYHPLLRSVWSQIQSLIQCMFN